MGFAILVDDVDAPMRILYSSVAVGIGTSRSCSSGTPFPSVGKNGLGGSGAAGYWRSFRVVAERPQTGVL